MEGWMGSRMGRREARWEGLDGEGVGLRGESDGRGWVGRESDGRGWMGGSLMGGAGWGGSLMGGAGWEGV